MGGKVQTEVFYRHIEQTFSFGFAYKSSFYLNTDGAFISHLKMLHDGTILFFFIANYVYTYDQYARTVISFCWSALTIHFNFALVPKTQSWRLRRSVWLRQWSYTI